MTEEDDRDALEQRVKQLQKNNDYLRHSIQGKTAENTNLHARVKHLEDAVAQEHKWFLQTHSAMNLLRQDADRVMTENGADDLHHELTEARRRYDDLWNKRVQWRAATRNATNRMAEATQHARDLEEVLEELRQRVTRTEEERDRLAGQAQNVVGERDGQTERIKHICERWHRGEIAAMPAVAGILAELRGSKLPEPSDWDRTKALKVEEMRAEITDLTKDLASVNTALSEAGVEIVSTHAVAVRDIVRQRNGALLDVEDWKDRETVARGAAVGIARHFRVEDRVVNAITVGDYQGVLVTLTGQYEPYADQEKTP